MVLGVYCILDQGEIGFGRTVDIGHIGVEIATALRQCHCRCFVVVVLEVVVAAAALADQSSAAAFSAGAKRVMDSQKAFSSSISYRYTYEEYCAGGRARSVFQDDRIHQTLP